MKINEKLVLALLFICAVCISAGAFFEVHMTGAGKENLQTILTGFFTSESAAADFKSCFFNSLKYRLPAVFASFFAPFIFITMPVLPIYIAIQSIALGFAAAMTLEAAGLLGMIYVGLYLMPQNLVLLPALAVLAAAAVQAGCSCFSFRFLRRKQKRKALQFNAGHYLKIYLIGSCAVIISCLLEAFLLQLSF